MTYVEFSRSSHLSVDIGVKVSLLDTDDADAAAVKLLQHDLVLLATRNATNQDTYSYCSIHVTGLKPGRAKLLIQMKPIKYNNINNTMVSTTRKHCEHTL